MAEKALIRANLKGQEENSNTHAEFTIDPDITALDYQLFKDNIKTFLQVTDKWLKDRRQSVESKPVSS
jgi:hypothetical protein